MAEAKPPTEVIPQPDGVQIIVRTQGAEPGTGTVSTWNMQGDQIEAHMRGIDDAAPHPFKNVSRGDLSAARDAANEAKKQVES